MIAKLRELFSVTRTKQKESKPIDIELVSCPIREMMCNVHLTAINNSLWESLKFQKAKEYHKSIEILKGAFQHSSELMENPCSRCAQHFRFKIFETLEYLHDELKRKSNGFFSKKIYKSSFLMAKEALIEFENAGGKNYMDGNYPNNRFLGNHLN